MFTSYNTFLVPDREGKESSESFVRRIRRLRVVQIPPNPLFFGEWAVKKGKPLHALRDSEHVECFLLQTLRQKPSLAKAFISTDLVLLTG